MEAEYTYYPGVDQPHSVRLGADNARVYYYATEEPGHVSGLIDGGNRLVNRYTYTPWGDPQAGTTEAVYNPLEYGARERDAESGLVYLRNRYYDPQTGRFLSEDPIGLAGGINPYAYVGNDPVNATDPSGLHHCRAGGTIGALGGRATTGAGYVARCDHRGAGSPGDAWAEAMAFERLRGEYEETRAEARAALARIDWGRATDDFLTGGPGICGNPGSDPNNCAIAATVPGWITGLGGGSTRAAAITFGHGARHLASSGLAQEAVEGAIRAEIQASIGNASLVSAGFWGRLQVAGRTIEYRAHTLTRGIINVGTYLFP